MDSISDSVSYRKPDGSMSPILIRPRNMGFAYNLCSPLVQLSFMLDIHAELLEAWSPKGDDIDSWPPVESIRLSPNWAAEIGKRIKWRIITMLIGC